MAGRHPGFRENLSGRSLEVLGRGLGTKRKGPLGRSGNQQRCSQGLASTWGGILRAVLVFQVVAVRAIASQCLYDVQYSLGTLEIPGEQEFT